MLNRIKRILSTPLRISSIRKFLLIYLLLAIGLTTSITIMGNYYFDQKDIQEHVDSVSINSDDTLPPNYLPIEIGAHEKSSHELGWRIVRDDIFIMLLTFPLSGVLIWIIIGRGLRTLNDVTNEVANRAPSHLEPVDLKAIPDEIRPLIDELNHLFFRLKEGFDREKRFAADAAHELKTPLAAIKAQAQVAINTTNEEEKNLALSKLITCVDRGTHIIQQLLTMSKLVPHSPTAANDFIPIKLSKIARDVLAMLTPSALEKGIELELSENPYTRPIHGNSTTIGILLRNLIDNAIRYSPNNSLILVRIYQEGSNTMVVEVNDQGPGIPVKQYSRVFERFYRIIGSKATGSGLGLAIVQQICDMHGASISLHSQKQGPGLSIKVHFPLLNPTSN